MSKTNNLLKVANITVSVLLKVFLVFCVVYGFYALCTPGFCGFLVVYICLILLYTFIMYKFTKCIHSVMKLFSLIGDLV